MSELTFKLDYDDNLDDAVEKISKALDPAGYKIVIMDDQDPEDADAGTVAYQIKSL